MSHPGEAQEPWVRFERGQSGHQSLAADIAQAGEHIVAARRDRT